MNLNKKLIKGGAVAALAGVVTLASVLPGPGVPKKSPALKASTIEATNNIEATEVASKVQLPLHFVASAQTTEEIASKLVGVEAAAPVEVSPWESKLMPNVEEFLTIYTEASMESEPAGKLPRGAVADILERGEEWTKIHSGNVDGYVSNEHALFGADAEAVANELGTVYATSAVDGLNIRAEGSMEAAVAGILNTGSKIEVDAAVEAPEGWVAVRSGEATAYVNAEFVTVELELGKAISVEEEQAAIAAAKAEEEAQKAEAEAARKAEAELKATEEKKAADEAEETKAQAKIQSTSTEGMRSATFKATAYCPCAICCGQWSGNSRTASGTVPTAGRTIAVDPSVIPLGSTVKVKMPNGSVQTFVAEDTGYGVGGNSIDIFFNSHSEALSWGLQNVEVWY